MDYPAFFIDCFQAVGKEHAPSKWQKRETELLGALTFDFLTPAPRDALYRLFFAIADGAMLLPKPLPTDLMTRLAQFAPFMTGHHPRRAFSLLKEAETILQTLPLSLPCKRAVQTMIRECRCLLLQIL